MTAIDWTNFQDSTCYCRCGAEYRSPAKFVAVRGGMVSKRPCPNCGEHDNLRRVSSDPETFSL